MNLYLKSVRNLELKNRYWAWLVTALYVLLVTVAFAWVSFDFDNDRNRHSDIIYVEMVPEPPVQPDPPKRVAEAPRHERVATTDNTQQVTGTDEQTRTGNPRAIFHMNKGGVDEEHTGGNPYATEDEQDKASGTGGGLNPRGTDQLDTGLQGRGLVGDLPLPVFPNDNRSGKVVIRVTVNSDGTVASAVYEQRGSTTNDGVLVEAAKKAALKARFAESSAAVQGGTITYIFSLR